MPYSGSYFAELNRIRVTATSTELVQDIGSLIYCSISGVPNDFELERLRIYSEDLGLTNTDTIDIKMLSDPGKYREAEAGTTGFGEPYVLYGMDDVMAEAGPNVIWLTDVLFDPPLKIRDDLKSNCLHFVIVSPAALTDDAFFKFDVTGYPSVMLYDESHHTVNSGMQPAKSLKVLRNTSTDIWVALGNITNPDNNVNAAISLFGNAADYVYFGMEETFEGLWFLLKTANSTDSITMVLEYWDGSAWSSLTVRDNCTDDATAPILFANSGVIEWDLETDWVIARLNDIVSTTGTIPYDFPETYDDAYKPRYWVRLNIDSITTQPVMQWIREKASYEAS